MLQPDDFLVRQRAFEAAGNLLHLHQGPPPVILDHQRTLL